MPVRLRRMVNRLALFQSAAARPATGGRVRPVLVHAPWSRTRASEPTTNFTANASDRTAASRFRGEINERTDERQVRQSVSKKLQVRWSAVVDET